MEKYNYQDMVNSEHQKLKERKAAGLLKQQQNNAKDKEEKEKVVEPAKDDSNSPVKGNNNYKHSWLSWFLWLWYVLWSLQLFLAGSPKIDMVPMYLCDCCI